MLEDLHAQIVRATKEGLRNKPRPSAGYRISSGCWPSCTSSSSPTWASRRCSRTSRSVHAWPSNEASSTFDGSRHRRLTAQLKQLEALLEHANALVLKNEVHKADERAGRRHEGIRRRPLEEEQRLLIASPATAHNKNESTAEDDDV